MQLSENNLPASPLRMAYWSMQKHLREGDTVVDATLGNGWDALNLARCVGEQGFLVGFDIQEAAVAASRQRLEEHGLQDRALLFTRSHAELRETWATLQLARPRLLVFNLGYLPGSDKQVVTLPESTLQCLEQGAELLDGGGAFSIVAYRGHPGAVEEYAAVIRFLETLAKRSWRIQRAGDFPENPKRPVFFWAEKPLS